MSLPKPPLVENAENVRAGFYSLGGGRRLRYAIFDPAGTAHATLLVTPGRREFIEKKFSELGPEFLARGFRIIIVEWRGQGMSSRSLEGARRQRDHITDFSLYIDDLNGFYENIVKINLVGPLVIHGHSMGGHLLVRWLTERPNLAVAGVFLTAPMLALAGSFAHASANFISWSSGKLGYGQDYAPMQHDYNEEDRAFAGNPLSHDPDRFAIIEKYFSAHPDMAVGGVTWDWLHAAIKSMFMAQRRHKLEYVAQPVLTIIGSEDRVTPPDESARYLKLMPKAETVIIPGSRHDIMNEIAPSRDEAWRQIDGFLQKLF
jgi:lysophospholipase